LGAVATDPSATVVTEILDGVLALGIDVDTPSGRTQGNRSLLMDTTNGNDIGMWTHPNVIPQAFPDIRQKVEKEVNDEGATLNSFDLHIEEGWLYIGGNASKTGGAVNFSLHAVPRLVRPGTHVEFDDEYGEHFDLSTPDREELWFEPTNIVVDVDRDWWVIVADGFGVLLAGIGYMIVESFVDMGGPMSPVASNRTPRVGARGTRNSRSLASPGLPCGSGSKPSSAMRKECLQGSL
jgi:hypothetical protein